MTSKSKADYLAKYLSNDSKKKKKNSSSKALVIDQDDSLMIAPPPAARSIDPQVTIRTVSSSAAHPSNDPIPLSTLHPVGDDSPPADHGVNTVVIPKLARPRGRHDSDSDDDDEGPPRRRMRYDSDSDDDAGGRGGDQRKSDQSRQDAAQADAPPGGTTVHRDARGRKVAVADLKQEAAAAEQAQIDKMNKDKLFMMGRVQLEQMREKRRQLAEGSGDLGSVAASSSAPASASADPLKDRMRWGDPGAMLGLVEKQKAKMRDPDRPQYEGGWALNRYMIPPGFRWDGIDRSNGFERKLLMRQNERAADEEAKYKWRSEDM